MVTKLSTFLSVISFFLLVSSSSPQSVHDSLLECISERIPSNTSIDSVLHFPSNPSYEPILESAIQNLRFLNHSYPKPFAIITPLLYSHVQAAVVCAKENGLRIRVRSGGHDYEGMSYTSRYGDPFVIVDLINLTSVTVDMEGENKTAWVQAGATLGQLYYWTDNKTQDHGFPAGICPTVGVGGLISGGGIGHMTRKHGLSLDNVIDALIVDVNGRLLDKDSMGEDLFWAIRGGGVASFGILVAWKVQLVRVPPIVTVFNISRSLEQGAIELIQISQLASYSMNESLRMRIEISTDNGTTTAKFSSMFLGTADELLTSMEESFPQLGLRKEDCKEMSWIDSVMYFSDYPAGESKEALRDRKPQPKTHFKAKSDFVVKPLSKDVIAQLWSWCSEKENIHLVMHSYGGRMNEIPENQTPFPFRNGTLSDIEYMMGWEEDDPETARKNIHWVRRLYKFMTPYVSTNPRGAYSNFRDFDIGINGVSGATFAEAWKWGFNYFKGNFKRLAIVKGMVDPENYFAYEQSIPPLRVIQQRAENKLSPATAAVWSFISAVGLHLPESSLHDKCLK